MGALLFLFNNCATSVSPSQRNLRLTFIGNSYQDNGFDFDAIHQAFGCQVDHLWEPGSMTAWAYAQFCRCVKDSFKSQYYFITFIDNQLSVPTFRTDGSYWTDIVTAAQNDSFIIDTINNVLSNSASITDAWNFNESVENTFLPRIISIAE